MRKVKVLVREFFQAVHLSAKSDNGYGYKVMALCGLVILGQIVYGVRLYKLF